LATRKHPLAIFIGVAMAFVIQSVVAVSFGSALGLLPRRWVSVDAAVLFMLFAFLMWRRKDHEEENLHLENQPLRSSSVYQTSIVVSANKPKSASASMPCHTSTYTTVPFAEIF
jgi:putative Ca2+/H+ antiporter (TMEM165/GDT1 family)